MIDTHLENLEQQLKYQSENKEMIDEFSLSRAEYLLIKEITNMGNDSIVIEKKIQNCQDWQSK